jgi:hypothetical protein
MSTLFRVRLLAAVLAAAPLTAPFSALAGGKTHLGVKPSQVVSISTTLLANDNSVGHAFGYDRGPVPFSVPAGFSFVVTDVVLHPEVATLTGTERFKVLIDTGDRFFSLDHLGPETRHYPLAGGIVVPSGASLTARNTTFSTHSAEVRVLGYFVKGAGLPFGESPFPNAVP